ncbi:hypothetical protein Elgi_41340 [Paenibacillus elgii]|nr:hypothetical protein Elgi_41340 [Paenibacillus elgii]
MDDGQIWMTPDSTAYQAVYDTVNGWDRLAVDLVQAAIKQIGSHIFCK